MQTLHIVPRLMKALRAGKKRHTIRWQEANITPGPLRYISSEDPESVVIVNVERVVTLPLSSVAQYLGKDDEWPDAVLLAGMQECRRIIRRFSSGQRLRLSITQRRLRMKPDDAVFTGERHAGCA